MDNPSLNRVVAPRTDEEIDRAVALARGWTEENRVGYTLSAIGTYMVWLDRDGREVDKRLFFVSSSPAAWGALLIEITKAPYFYRIALIYEVEWLAYIYPPHGAQNENEVIGYASNAEPGRALALAFLKAVGKL